MERTVFQFLQLQIEYSSIKQTFVMLMDSVAREFGKGSAGQFLPGVSNEGAVRC